jgi:Tol biopolymer transport system component
MMRAATLLIAVTCGVVALARPATGHEPLSGAGGNAKETIVYSTLQPDNWDVYLFDGTEAPARRLTDHPALDYNATFSPDGRWVVFTSEREGNTDLYAIDLSSSGEPKRLTRNRAMEDAADFSPDGQRLIFVSTRSGNSDIFAMPFAVDDANADAAAVNLTNSEKGDYNPQFSPYGQWIAFASSRDAVISGFESLEYLPNHQASDIYVMKADGSEVKRLTRDPLWDGSPAWTPDGKKILFYSTRDGEPRICVTDPEGADPVAISKDDEPALSPAAMREGRVAFSVRTKGKWRIVSTAADGSDLRILSDEDRPYWAPAFDRNSGRMVCHGPGPTGAEARFASDTPGPFFVRGASVERDGLQLDVLGVRGYIPTVDRTTGQIATSEGFGRLVACALDGSHMRVLFDRAHDTGHRGELSAWSPSWSWDGKWLACAVGTPFAGPEGLADDVNIWRFRPDGTGAENLTTDSKANDAFPQISPDGSRIVFRSNRYGNFEICMMDADGKNVRRLTNDEATDTMPDFSSAGDRIVFSSRRTGDFELYVIDLDRRGEPSQPRRITHSVGHDMHPRFSPDDQWVLFTSARGHLNDEIPLLAGTFNPQPYGELFAQRLKDNKVVRLTHNKWEDGPSTWVRLGLDAASDLKE